MKIQSLLVAFGIALLTVFILAPVTIPLLHKLKFGQSIREEGPKSHQKKSGTPTMGGLFLVAGILIGTFAAVYLYEPDFSFELGLAVFIMLGHFVLGFIDDFRKVVRKQNLGLRAREKLAGQIFIAIVTILIGSHVLNFDTTVWIPITDDKIDIGIGYYFLIMFVLVGASNAVNLTDGLDGLASGTVAIAFGCYMVICLAMLKIQLAIFCAAIIGACIGFLRFNFHPAKIFMGDTGSLALGGAFAAVGILTRTEVLLAVIGLIFVCEALSVIIQVISFQSTGKRVFRMTPIHHHFELGGWSEIKVVYTFWTVGLIAGLLGLMLYVGS